MVQRILNYYPNYPTHCLYFGEVETPYTSLTLRLDYCKIYLTVKELTLSGAPQYIMTI